MQVLSIGSPLMPMLSPLPAIAAVVEVAQAPAAAVRGPFEETWDFINRFYVDRTYNGNDWAAVHSKYSQLVKSGKLSDTAAAEKILSLLHDKYTRLVNPSTYESLSKYDMVGAGVMLSPNQEGRLAVASPPIPASSADKNGIKKGDLIVAINDFLSKYQDPTITFTVQKPGKGEDGQRVLELERAFEKISNPVEYSLSEQSNGKKVGYIQIKEFNAVVTDKVREAIVDLESQGAEAYVLDLRGNGGGAFQSALGIAGLFMNDKLITYVVDGDGKKASFTTKSEAITNDPLVVFIDKGSA
eukprot:14930-Heterococcus_DN1.PRE.1